MLYEINDKRILNISIINMSKINYLMIDYKTLDCVYVLLVSELHLSL